MKAFKKITNKVNNSKIIKNPVFLVIGLIAIIIVIALIYFIFLKYSPIMNFKYEGYAVSGKKLTENLLDAGETSGFSKENEAFATDNKNLELAKIEEQGTIFKKLNNYFVGNKEKTEINLNYPIYINNNSTIYNLSKESMLISKDFEEIASYPNLSISEGKAYDGNNLERADSKEYIFVKTADNIYINLVELKINTTVNEYTIPVNCVIAFTENSIRYYAPNKNILVFNQINDVDTNSSVQMVENNYTYEEFLTKLGILVGANNTDTNQEDQSNIIQENTTNDNNEANQESELKEKQEETEEEPQTSYIKPEVTVEDFTAEVYTAKSTLTIKDPAGRIVEAPTFEIYKDGKIYLRRTYTNSGSITVTGLVPATEFKLVGKYIYLNENGQKVENTFYEGSFTTKGYEALGSIELAKENGEIYSNKIQVTKVRITSDLNAEVIKGINQVEIETGEIRTVLKNSQVNELLQGKELTIESSEGLKSNSKINYTIKFFDKNGIELKVTNNTGETRTSKQEPTVRVSIKEQDIVSVTLKLNLTNKDNVNLENYKYIVTRPNGELVKEEKLATSEKTLKLEDLDQNQYYKIGIYADYDLNDNKGKQEQVELGNLVFATQPISTLGSLELIVENKELTSTSSTITYKINEDRTDKRLIQILNELTINIVEQPGNTTGDNSANSSENDPANSNKTNQENNTKQETKVIYTETLTGDEISNLQQGGTKEIKYENLKSNTKYTIEITGAVQLGNTQESIPITYNYKEFTTLKIPAKVELRNQFVTGNLIDFDVRVEDINNSVLNNKVRMELRDENNNLINLEEISTNQDYKRKTYEKLEENQTYKLSFYADQYNEGSTDATYKVNYLITELEIITEPGISGSIGLTELTKKSTGKNLVDMSSEIKWYVYPNFNTFDYYGKEYNAETKTLTLGGHNNTRRAVYDLREYAGQEVTMSFKAKAVNSSQTAYIQNSKTDTNRTLIQGITEEWKDFQYTLTVDSTGYLGFCIQGGNGIEIQELQIELGNKKTSYEEFKYNLQSNYSINLEDKRDEISTNDYYIKVYEDNNLIKADRYVELPENNTIENAIKTYETQAGKKYKVELAIKIKDREYVLSDLEYNTQDTEEIKGIYNKEDFLEIQPRGHYIVLGDIDLRGGTGFQYRFGNDNLKFEGVINFNGKNLIYTNQLLRVFERTSDSAVIKNIVINLYLNSSSDTYGMIYKNYGTLENVMMNVYDIYDYYKSNYQIFITNTNYGLINKCIINLKTVLKVKQKGCSIYTNSGTIKNTYIVGNKIDASEKLESEYWKNIAGLCYKNDYGGKIENAYSTIDVELAEGSYQKNAMPLVSHNYGNYVKNVYSTGDIINGDKNNGINVYANYNANSKVENSYYMSDDLYNVTYDKKTTKLALYDCDFQNNMLNSENAFQIEENIQNGYYPKLILPDCMPEQEYIKLPEVTDADLPDIIYSEILEQTSSTAKVKLRVHNPSAETVTNIKIKNVTCNILEQEYNEGQSTVIVELNNPIYFTSSYEVISISTKGAFNKEYTRNYASGERSLNIDLYKEIRTIDEWNAINKSASENYILMNDLDFINNGNKAKITVTYAGKIKGNGYTIKNIQFTSGGNIFTNISSTGKIENLYISTYQSIGNIGAGIIGQLYGEVNNIHITNEKIEKKSDTADNQQGGLVNANYGNIYNCSVNNVEIKNYSLSTTTRIGGLVGIAVSGNIENSYVYNLNIDVKDNLSYDGVGGLIGRIQGQNANILNCYVEGNIVTDAEVGGIVGTAASGSIQNCYSLVNIYTDNVNAAGIVSYLENGNINGSMKVENNLFLGKLYSSAENSNVATICRNAELNNNYVYENATINGFTIENAKNVITEEELKNRTTYLNKIKLGNEFNYENIHNGELPLLNAKGTSELLPNQTHIKITEKNSIYIEEIVSEKSSVNELTANIIINNETNKEIVDLKIENVQVTSKNIITRNGKTYITISAMPTKYYDSYKINELTYLENGEEKSVETYGKIEVKFYKELYTVSDWQDIEVGTYQNYKLMNDIDFRNISNIKYNVTMKELSTNNSENYVLKNIKFNTDERNSGFIKKVDVLENITFENVDITSTANYRIGVIVANSKADNCNFYNIKINAEKAEIVGCIAINDNTITNINLNQIEIKAYNYVGALIGKTDRPIDTINYNNVNIAGLHNVGGLIGWSSSTANNIKAKENIKVEGSNYVGGVAGYSCCNALAIHKAQLSDVQVKGNYRVGGIVGHGDVYESEIENSNVTGNKYTGGIAGLLTNSQDKGNIVTNVVIKGTNYVGGIAGTSYDLHTTDNQVTNATIIGDNYVGGIAGFFGRQVDLRFNAIKNSNIEATGDYVGGIVGKTETKVYGNYCINTTITGSNNVGGIVGEVARQSIYNNYTNASIKGISKVGGLIGFLNNERMEDNLYVIDVFNNYAAGAQITGDTMIGGLIGGIYKNLGTEKHYYCNFAQVKIQSTDLDKVSLGIGSTPQENLKLIDTYYYKYSNINGENPNGQNEVFISSDRYLVEEDLKQQTTYISKLKWNTNDWNYTTLQVNKYPTLKSLPVPDQEGIDLPIDSENIVGNSAYSNKLEAETQAEEPEQISENGIDAQGIDVVEKPEQTFEYEGKIIQTYRIYSVITAEDGSQVRRNVKLYVKNNKLYAIPTVLSSGQESSAGVGTAGNDEATGKIETVGVTENATEKVVPVANNLILDSYNGKEYETVLGSDGKIYDLKDPITYPENFLNSDIESIGNNLNSDSNENSYENSHEIEVTYKNGDKLKFDYQTGEVLDFSEADSSDSSEQVGLFDYIKEKISDIGNSTSDSLSAKLTNKYEASKELQAKLEEMPIEEALKRQGASSVIQGDSTINGAEGVATTENETTNNSLKENKYMSVYDEKIDDYRIYKEEELLDTSKEEVVSENEKIEANNLSEYYASEGKTRNTKMGIVWIVISIILAGIILIILGGIWGRWLNPGNKKRQR